MATGARAALGSGIHPQRSTRSSTPWQAVPAFPKRNPARDRRATALSELPLLQAAFPKTVLKTFSRNCVNSTEL